MTAVTARLAAVCPLLASLLLAPCALAAWPSNPDTNVAIGELNGEQGVVKVATSPDGGAWFGWFDNSTGAYQVRVQKVDYLGNEVFAHNGIVVSANPQSTSLEDWDLRADSSGGCLVAFNDTRAGPDRDVYAYRLSSAGAFLWGANGVTISNNINGDTGPRVFELSNGDFGVVHARLVQAGGETPGLIYTRLAPDGTVLGAMTIAGDGVEQPSFLEVVPSDAGSFIVSWVRDTRTFMSPRQVRGQKFDAAGAPLWNAGAPLALSLSSIVPIAHLPRLVSDENGGALFAWHISALQAFVQRVNAAGTELWTPAGVQIALDGANLSMDPAVAFHPASGSTTVFYRKTNSGQTQQGLSVQTLDSAGNRTLGLTGSTLVALGQPAVAAPRAVRLDNPETLCVYSTTVFGGTDTTVWATRVSGAGSPLWPGAPVRLSPTTGARFRLGLARAANGVARVFWEGDTRNLGTTPDAYAQNVNPNGSRGACAGDGNFDGLVNFGDLNNVLGQFGQTGLFLLGDVNGDGAVNFGDLNIVLGGFGATCP